MAKRRASSGRRGRGRTQRKSGRSASSRSRPARHPIRRLAGILLLASALAATAYAIWVDVHVRAQFEGKRWQVPARIYARALEVYPGAPMDPSALEAELKESGYHSGSSARAGGYQRRGNTFEINRRAFRFWDGEDPARFLRVDFAGGKVARVRDRGGNLALARLEPALIGRVYPGHGEDRILVRLEEVPPLFIKALLSVEDRGFYRHSGISVRSVARAAWANLRAGQAVQGGSTITQQLAKNFFLTPERTLTRKLNEALYAVLLELHYGKSEILEAYLNEVYLGQQGNRAIHGFGLAAHHYFGRQLEELEVHEMALLVALVRGPSYYNPRAHPERARRRRDLVIDMMTAQEAISEARAETAKARALGVLARPPAGRSPFPAFLDLVQRQLARDYGEEDLRSEGLRIFTTLDPLLQRHAESALAAGIRKLEGRKRALPAGTLQGALVLTGGSSAEVLALVGGRAPREAGFNRALDARRPIGSLVKPAVYLTALEQPGKFHLLTPVDDTPVRLKDRGGRIWSPKNYDGTSRGPVPLYQGLAQSYNLATVNLGNTLGVRRVLGTLHKLGAERPVAPYPSVFLGALELSPLEVAQVYQTIADGGFRTPLRAIREVTDARGRPLTRYPLRVEQAVPPGPAYLLTHALERVMREGTGRSAYRMLPPSLAVAGKTGTTDDLRDSWFAGFTGGHVAVVWLGRDDNRPTGLSGASGALQIWSALIGEIRTRGVSAPAPENVVFATGGACRGNGQFPFIRGFVPDECRVPVADTVQPKRAPSLAAERH